MSVKNRLNKVESSFQDIKCKNCKHDNVRSMSDEELHARIDELISKDIKGRPEWYENQLQALRG